MAPNDPVHMRGPVLVRREKGGEHTTTDQRLLDKNQDTDWLHTDPWRVLRIQAEFVEGFGALAGLPRAVTVFGSARTKPGSKYYEKGVEIGAALADELLADPLSRDDAVRLALTRSPAVQALLAQGWAELAAARQLGRLPNPVFSFERVRLGGEVELGRAAGADLLARFIGRPASQVLVHIEAEIGEAKVTRPVRVRHRLASFVGADDLETQDGVLIAVAGSDGQ